MYESVINRKKLSDNGVGLVSAMENIPDTPEGKLFQAVIEGFNEYYSEDLRQKVNRGLRESWIKGNATGGIPPFGYVIKDKKYVIDETEADAVREIFRKYSQGFKANSIADDLKERNVRRKNGKYIDQKYVYVILHDKRYTGVVTHKGEEYYNIFPPIITKEVWSQVNAINEENKQAPSRKKEIFDYILSGNVICANGQHKILKAAELNVDQSRNPISDYGFPINLFFIINLQSISAFTCNKRAKCATLFAIVKHGLFS